MTRRILFLDVGDTLLSERDSRHAIYAAAARQRGLAVTPARMRELMLAAHRELPLEIDGCFRYGDPWFRRFIERIYCAELGLAQRHLLELQQHLFATFEDPATFELRAGARELVAAVRAHGWRVGIISNWSARLPRLLDRLGFADVFDPLVCSALVGCEKPAARIFEIALGLAQARPCDAVHAGDREDNDGAAAELGIATVLVDPPGRAGPPREPRRAVEGAALIRVSDLEALRTYILSLP
jgi:HAD superfamily hydrolase (TIGR01549 family)